MLRIAALSIVIALGASVHAASAGSFGFDMPRVTFATADSGTPTTPQLPTRACTAPGQVGAVTCEPAK